jgi:SAM-dependent methyltransferase
MADPTARRAVTELYAGQGWPADGDELLHRSLGPRSPEMLLEAPGWLGLGVDQLVLDAGCRDASYAAALARRYGCRVVGVDLVLAGVPKGGAYDAVAETAGSSRCCTSWSRRPRGAEPLNRSGAGAGSARPRS